jgi:DNA-binding HxlR family transcriptional regulator
LLNTRLAELRAAGLIEHASGYRLTVQGRALGKALRPLTVWTGRWAKARARR